MSSTGIILDKEVELTVVMPCLNEVETLATCIDKAMGYLARSGVLGEVLVRERAVDRAPARHGPVRGHRPPHAHRLRERAHLAHQGSAPRARAAASVTMHVERYCEA